MNPHGSSGLLTHDRRMGKHASRIKVVVRDVLLATLRERDITREAMAADLGIHRKTLDGLLRPNDPRPASQDVQEAMRLAYGIESKPMSPPVAGSMGRGGRVSFTTRPIMPAEVILQHPIADLDLAAGDSLRIEPHQGPMTPGCWYLISFGSADDVLVQASEHSGAIVFREADAPSDDLRAYIEGRHRVSYEATHGVRRLR